MTSVVEEVFALYERGGSEAYFGEDVTQLQHALQAANLAKNAKADDEVVLAALLHDIGHLLGGQIHAELGVPDHDRSGGQWLRERGFGERLIELVSGHVAAKRYLVSVKAGYYDSLSDASKRTLELQGGPMTPAEVRDFEESPLHSELLRLRVWDDLAKDPKAETGQLIDYRELLASHLARHQ